MSLTRRSFGKIALGTALSAAASGRSVFAQGSGAQTLSMGSVLPAAHPASICLAEACDAIRKDTAGKVDIKYYPSSQLGSEIDMQSQMRSGALEFANLSVSSLQTLVPAIGIPGTAFAFKNYDTLWPALDEGDLGAMTRKVLDKLGIVAFKTMDNGFRDIICGTRPIAQVSDLKGLKIRVPPSPLLTSLFSGLGASPTTINLGETYSALQTRIADGMENSLVNIEATKVYEVQKYCSRTGHSWDGMWVLSNKQTWNAFPDPIKAIITRHFDAAVAKQRVLFAKAQADAVSTLQAKGIVFNTPDRVAFRNALAAAGYYRNWKAKFGAEPWAALEKYTGPLGA